MTSEQLSVIVFFQLTAGETGKTSMINIFRLSLHRMTVRVVKGELSSNSAELYGVFQLILVGLFQPTISPFWVTVTALIMLFLTTAAKHVCMYARCPVYEPKRHLIFPSGLRPETKNRAKRRVNVGLIFISWPKMQLQMGLNV